MFSTFYMKSGYFRANSEKHRYKLPLMFCWSNMNGILCILNEKTDMTEFQSIMKIIFTNILISQLPMLLMTDIFQALLIKLETSQYFP